ncbi:M20/M25/M40 family metallo-hydrolase [Spirosoma spitsbergense]|uniref:M20/M25/M40 family metallo-hydrolase n=1 Tax=Spirosoma spitsbergense TaxID=431554 RepID=UPI00037D6FC9|nr:M20/M25/M40 family metallo-hydrolase [Spirosoma spitsbergense]
MMKRTFYALAVVCFMVGSVVNAQSKQPDWKAVEEETMEHFQAILRMNTSDPPGIEAPVVDYLKSVLQKEGIEVQTFALDPNRPNLVARLKGTGKKRPLLIMAHTDVVNVDSTKWTYPPFSATRKDGYVYGRGSVDDKDNVATGLMVMLLLKRSNAMLDRDVIFLAEAGEEGNVKYGIDYMVKNHWPAIEAEYCFAEGGGVPRTGGKIQYATVATTEKIPRGAKLVAKGISGHGSVPLQSNAVVHIAQAVAKVAAWQTPMRLNETTTAFFKRLAEISTPEETARFQALLNGKNADSAQEYLATKEPRYYSTLRTSISPTIIKGGYRSNVIPSEAEATLDIRALPDEDMPKFLDAMRQVINDPAVDIVSNSSSARPGSPPSKLNTEAFRAVEASVKRTYNTVTLPTMLTGATDMSYLRSKGVQCYGIGPMTDSEDGPKGFGAHSDQERILEEALHKFLRFQWDVVSSLAMQSSPE